MDPDPNGPAGSDSAANPDNATDEALRMQASLRSMSDTLAQIRECHQTQNNLMESLQHQIESFSSHPVIKGNDEMLQSIDNLARDLRREFNDQFARTRVELNTLQTENRETRAGLIPVRKDTSTIGTRFPTFVTEAMKKAETTRRNLNARRCNAFALSGTSRLAPMYSNVDHELIAGFPETFDSIDTLSGPTLDSLLRHLQSSLPPEVSVVAKKARLRAAMGLG
ncbi:hypothetical protein SLS55_010173 [Diplodia seriata]|uniref:Uncharacterized protein n=1 Tax=Diplodia seriata TaxID=420778 RepID=A0ABR3BYK3_9PEZI